MKEFLQYLFSVTLLMLINGTLLAQKDPFLNPAHSRALFHDFIDKEQQKALVSDGVEDKKFTVSVNEDINIHVTNALINKVNDLQRQIEHDSAMSSQTKIRYLRGIERLLKDMNGNWKTRDFVVTNLPAILDGYESCMKTDNAGLTIENEIEGLIHDVAKPIVNCSAFDANPGYNTCRNILVRKYCGIHPDQVFATLTNTIIQLPDLPFFDSLVKVAGKRYPRQLYDYASAQNEMGKRIRKINDPLINAVGKMAVSNNGSGQLYFPFLDNIINGKTTIEEIDAVKDDYLRYYKLLVRTHLDYTARLLNRDTAYEMESLDVMMGKKARDVFVNTINGLHESDDITRFKIIQPLNAPELYYLAVLSDGIIYTSSFVKGVFPVMKTFPFRRAITVSLSVLGHQITPL